MNSKPRVPTKWVRNPKLKLRPGRFFRYLYLKLIRANDSPHKVALGMAAGVALGIFPTFGVGAILALLLASLFKWNKASALLGSMIMNPFTTPFFWSLSALLGSLLAGYDWSKMLEEVKDGQMLDIMTTSCWIYLLGNTILSILAAGMAYLITLNIVSLAKKKRRRL